MRKRLRKKDRNHKGVAVLVFMGSGSRSQASVWVSLLAGERAEVSARSRRLEKGLGSGEAMGFWASSKPRDRSEPAPTHAQAHTHTVSAPRVNPCLPACPGNRAQPVPR